MSTYPNTYETVAVSSRLITNNKSHTVIIDVQR